MAGIRHSKFKRSIERKKGRNNGKYYLRVPFAIMCYLILSRRVNTTEAPDTNTTLTTEETGFDSTVSGRTERSFADSVAEPPQRPKSYWDDPHFRPYFDNSTEKNVTFQLSKPSYLQCRIRQLGDKSVSWVRQNDLHILTVGKYTYSSDQRYTCLHIEGSDDWTLEIKYTTKKDAGVYECQVSTEPKMSLPIRLNVVTATAKILQGPILYIQSGSTINLTCVAEDYATPPVYVFWYHDDEMIDYDLRKGRGIKVTTDKGLTTYSRFVIDRAQASDSGNYSCQASFADPANITVHVLNGEKPAAMQHGHNGSRFFAELSLLLISLSVMSSFYLM